MATAVLTNTPTIINGCNDATDEGNWNGDTFTLEPDIKVEGANSIACAQTNNGVNDIYVSGTWDLTGGEHLRLWVNSSYVGAYGDIESNNGMQIFISDGTNTAYWTVGGSDTYGGGWVQFVTYTGGTPTSGTVPTGNSTQIGFRINTTAKPRNVPANMWVDQWIYGDGYTITGGTSGDEIDWSYVSAIDKTNAYGIVTRIDDIYFFAGDVIVGNGATTTYFNSGQKIQFKDLPVLSTLYSVTFEGSACNVDIAGGTYGAAGTQNFTFDASDTNLNSFDLSGVQFEKASSVTFSAGETILSSVFNNCGQVDPSTSTFTGMIFSNYIGTTGALLFPSDDSNISGLEFINCDNGVEYDSSSDASSPKFDDFTFDDEAGNYDVNNTSGIEVSISKNNGSDPNSYNPSGDIVNFLGASVTTQITVKDVGTGLDVENARVLLWVTDGTNFPHEASITSITGTGTTATVTHTNHGLSTADNVWIQGANQENYVGAYEIIVTGVDTYTYTTAETIITSPATGTITSTFLFLNKLTNSSGIASDNRVVGSNQPMMARIRKSTTSPYYQQGTLIDTIDSVLGYTATVGLVEN
ncbi:MAG: hypothetical protein ACTSQF_01845 [Candidatus Heimdallarchaeaceae archaeon]